MNMKTMTFAAVVALGILPALPSGAQALLHRYSFNGGVGDSAGGADGTVVGNVSLSTAPGVNGQADFAGASSGSNPGYVSLPASTVNSLENATVEIFTTNFNMPTDARVFQALFAVSTPYGNQTNYAILSANRGGGGIGTGSKVNGGAETVINAQDSLPVWRQNHVVDLVYSGFTGVGSTGMETIYLDGVKVAQGPTTLSFKAVAAGQGGISVVGIGGGSPFNDPTFSGSINEVRIFSGALSVAQVAQDVAAGPGDLGFIPDPAPLALLNISVGPIADKQATVTWKTNSNADSVIHYGLTAAYGMTVNKAAPVSGHAITLTGLTAHTTYHYSVSSTNALNETVSSPDATFSTITPTAIPHVRVTGTAISRDRATGQLLVTVVMANNGTGIARNVNITGATLGTAATTATLPWSMGNLPSSGMTRQTLRFATQPAGSKLMLNLNVTFDGGLPFSSVAQLTAP